MLPNSERFALGDATIGRGFAPGNTSGDSGWGGRVELRRQLAGREPARRRRPSSTPSPTTAGPTTARPSATARTREDDRLGRHRRPHRRPALADAHPRDRPPDRRRRHRHHRPRPRDPLLPRRSSPASDRRRLDDAPRRGCLEGRRATRGGHAHSDHQRRRHQRARAWRSPRRSPRELAGPAGEVWVVAPAFEQSGVAHAVSYVRPMRHRAARGRAASPSRARRPTACSPALYEIMKDAPPDLVISGVNRGHNVAEDTLYSGTVGGAMEAALHGVPRRRAVAVLRPARRRPRRPVRRRARARRGAAAPAARRRRLAERALRRLLQRQLPGAAGGRGARHRAPPSRATAPPPTFGVLPHVAPNGRTFLWLTHGHGNADSAAGLGLARVPRRPHHRDAAAAPT